MMFYKRLVLFCELYALQFALSIESLPSYFPRCHRTDPNIEQCLLDATEEVRPYIKVGVADFLPGIENFTVPQIVMEQGNRAINYKATLKNLLLLGLAEYKFTRFNFDVENGSFFIEVQLPHLYLKGQYVLQGNLFFAPIKGDGDFHANISNSNCSIYHTIEVVDRNGVDYIKPLITIPKMHVGKVTDYGFDGLFKDNKNLEQVTSTIIKNNLDVIIEELTPAIEKVLASIFDNVIFKSVTKIPYDELYPI